MEKRKLFAVSIFVALLFISASCLFAQVQCANKQNNHKHHRRTRLRGTTVDADLHHGNVVLDDSFTEIPTPFHRSYIKDGVTVIEQVPNIKQHNEQWKQIHSEKFATVPPPVRWVTNPANVFPTFKTTLMNKIPSSPWSSPCFQNNTATIVTNDQGATISIEATNPVSLTCYDLYLLADSRNFYVTWIFKSGNHRVLIKQWRENEQSDVEKYGLFVFGIEDGILGSLVDLFDFIEFFMPPFYFSKARTFLEQNANYTFHKRAHPGLIPIKDTDIKSGDYIAITNWYGYDVMIMYGTGGRTSHACVALWIDGELYILESVSQKGPTGIIKTPWAEWLKRNVVDDAQISILRLAPEYQARFDELAALEFFKSVEGLPYGMDNIIFSWIDTPDQNFPQPLTPQLLGITFAFLDRWRPTVGNIYVEGLNLRLGTSGLNMDQITQVLEERNLTLPDLLVMPEQDDWIYPSVGGRSMVCDVFVLATYKAAGVFGNLTFQAAEATPRDSYMIKIFDSNWQRPEPCLVDDLPYCQIAGTYLHELPGFNTIEPYENMNQKCPSMPPEYWRPEGC